MSQFQFVMRSGPTPGMTFPLEGDQLTIGRDASNAVAINDAEVSRKHARLLFQGGKYVLEDLGSTNGTFVNGQRLSGPVVLKPGDVISLGEQIVLMYDSVNVDPGATMASPRKFAQPAAAPRAPVVPSAPPAHVPPPPAAAYAPPSPAAKKNIVPIVAIVGALLFLCLCFIAVLFWVDSDPSGARWCMFPFNLIALMFGASCP